MLDELVESAGIRVVTAPCDLAALDVTWVQSTELADMSPYVSGGELILTTGMWRVAGGAADAFVRVLCEAKVSALGYGLSPGDTGVPRDVVAACESQRLCLLEIPVEMPFIAISKIFVEWYSAQREAWLVGALRRSEAMTRAVRDGRGLDGVLAILVRDTGIDSAVVTGTGETLAKSARVSPAMIESMAGRLDGRAGDDEAISPSPSQALVFEVADPFGGSAFLLCFPSRGLDNESRQAVDQAIAHIGVELSRRGAIRATELRFAGELLELIAAGSSRLRELNERLSAFGIDPDAGLGALAVSSVHDKSTQPEVSVLDRTVHELSVSAIVVARAAEHLLFLQVDSAQRLNQIAEAVLGRLRSYPGVSAAAVGVGFVVPNALHLAQTVSTARRARVLAEHDPAPYCLAAPERGGSHELLLAIADGEALAALAGSLVTPVREHDARHHSELLRTLATFLESSGQWKQTADELHIHVNTLRNRIRRIELITGRDLSTMAARVDFYLALKADR